MKDQAPRPTANPGAGEAAQIAEQDRIAQLCRDTFNTPAGSALLDHLCQHFGLLDRVFTKAGQGDPVIAAVRDGERGVLVYILKQLRRVYKDGKGATVTLPLPK